VSREGRLAASAAAGHAADEENAADAWRAADEASAADAGRAADETSTAEAWHAAHVSAVAAEQTAHWARVADAVVYPSDGAACGCFSGASLEPSGLSLASQRPELCTATDEASAANAGRAAAAEASAAAAERAALTSAAAVEWAAAEAGAAVTERAAHGASAAVAECAACYETCAIATASAVGHVGAPGRIAICDGRAECAVSAVETSARDPVFSSADERITRFGAFAERFTMSGADPVNGVGRSTVNVASGRSEVAARPIVVAGRVGSAATEAERALLCSVASTAARCVRADASLVRLALPFANDGMGRAAEQCIAAQRVIAVADGFTADVRQATANCAFDAADAASAVASCAAQPSVPSALLSPTFMFAAGLSTTVHDRTAVSAAQLSLSVRSGGGIFFSTKSQILRRLFQAKGVTQRVLSPRSRSSLVPLPLSALPLQLRVPQT